MFINKIVIPQKFAFISQLLYLGENFFYDNTVKKKQMER